MSNFPSFYDPSRIGTLYYPDYAAIAAEAVNTNLTPASSDKQSVHLVIIDMQVDFCHENGSLYVPVQLAIFSARLSSFTITPAALLTLPARLIPTCPTKSSTRHGGPMKTVIIRRLLR